MPLPGGNNHLGSVSIDTPALAGYTNAALGASRWTPVVAPCTLDFFTVHNKDASTLYLLVYDSPSVLVAAFPIPPSGIVFEHPRLKIGSSLSLALSTAADTFTAPATPGVATIGVQTWVSGSLPS